MGGLCGSGRLASVALIFPWPILSPALSPQIDNLLLVAMQSVHLAAQRKAFQQSMDDLLTLRCEQTSSQPLIAKALHQLKVAHPSRSLTVSLSGTFPIYVHFHYHLPMCSRPKSQSAFCSI